MSDEIGGGPRGDVEQIAPVIPLFGGASRSGAGETVAASRGSSVRAVPGAYDEAPHSPSERHPARRAKNSVPAPHLRALQTDRESRSPDEPAPIDPDELRATASESLLRKLRSRSLSVVEARQILRGHGLDGVQIDDVIDDFLRRRYLDDHELAQALVTSGVERKGQGRVALSRALAQRGISREVIDSALDELPDDDDERALEFARTKARSLSRLDHDTALRRLMGQLARRGYNGRVAMGAAKTALKEASFGAGTTGVRFVESD